MRITSIILILSSLFLVSCIGAKDNTPAPKTSDTPLAQEEPLDAGTTVSWNEVSEQTPQDTLDVDSQATVETSLENF